MGLASVYGTITEHLGMIHVSSKPGKGTTFCVFLPATDKALETDTSTQVSPPVSSQCQIMSVDDEEDVRLVAGEMLEELGYDVVLCQDGTEAVDYYRKSWQKIDLVVLDMMMPGLSGKETFSKLQKINPQLRAVILSGFSLNEQIQELLDAGAISYISKPFEQKQLSEVVAQTIKQ